MDSFTQSMVVYLTSIYIYVSIYVKKYSFIWTIYDVDRYATERGGVHSWDLRAKEEPFYLKNKPNLGLFQIIFLLFVLFYVNLLFILLSHINTNRLCRTCSSVHS